MLGVQMLFTKEIMASKVKPLCKFGEKCYRRNPQHLSDFTHPKRKYEQDEDTDEEVVVKKAKKEPQQPKTKEKKTIADFFSKKADTEAVKPKAEAAKASGSADEGSEPEDSNKDDEDATPDRDEHGSSQSSEQAVESGSDNDDTEIPSSPEDIKDNIKSKFLVEMPEDFYQFWDFCKTENRHKPPDALLKVLGFRLVGPFDILAGKHKGVTKNQHGRRPNFLLHWRYYFDPPEFLTVIRGDDKTQFHLGYFRDDPHEMPVFVGANSASNDCIISAKGDNLFAAVSTCIDEKMKSKDTDSNEKTKLKELSERVKKAASMHGLSLEVKSARMKERDKCVVCKSFHKAGIVVPVDDNEVGYREVPETPGDLKKMFKKIADSKTDSERDKNYEDLQELITLVQFANDECDYGEGLELGMDLFCYGGKVFHSTINQLLSLAYMLLNRNVFGTIIEAHLKHRSRESDLSQL